MFTSLIVPAILALAASAAAQSSDGDLNILNYALTLEHLEATFYAQGLSNFSAYDFETAGFSKDVRTAFSRIAADEATHVAALISIVNASYPNQAVPACRYTFPVTTVADFVTVASALENTGVSAYDGALQGITSNDYKTAAATIATVEGRHAAYLNYLIKKPITIGPFDTPLGVRPVVSIAANFITSCPYTLPVTPFPALTATLQSSIPPTLQLSSKELTSANSGSLVCNFVYGLASSTTVITTKHGEYCCELPADAVGVYDTVVLFLTKGSGRVTLVDDANVVAGPALVATAKVNVRRLRRHF